TLVAVARHPLHRSVQALRQPVAQVAFVVAELDATDAHALEAGVGCKRLQALRECGEGGLVQRGSIGCRAFHRASIESRDACARPATRRLPPSGTRALAAPARARQPQGRPRARAVRGRRPRQRGRDRAVRAGGVALRGRPGQRGDPRRTRRRAAGAPARVDSGDAFAPLLERATVVAIGPGLGRGDWARGLLHAALGTAKPMVLDADALNLLAEQPRAVGDAILTPHPGEAARLIGITTAEVQEGREASARALARSFDAVVGLKGGGALVAAPDGRMARIDAGNPGMATGGMGDLLTGAIAALRAQGLEAFDAAACGALLHAAAGDAAAAATAMRGLLPVDLLPQLQLLANPG